ncbi:MAG TPA: Uma2 family endonuclease [Pyrinomonadaceae bacterium]|nr:Uma2 family endonuclease [Pyrinomonadaceae bacterium]
MNTKLQTLTTADWEAMPHGDGNRYEIIEGELFVSCSPGLTHQRVTANLITLFVIFFRENPIAEWVPATGVVFSKHSAVIPDLVVFLDKKSDAIITGDRLTGPPDLVIEILSPGSANIRRDRMVKLQLYSKHAVPEYWIIDPGNLAVEQYVLHGSSLKLMQTLQHEDVLSSSAIPGFSCQVSEIFARIGK